MPISSKFECFHETLDNGGATLVWRQQKVAAGPIDGGFIRQPAI
jgi:hypothetical protein